MMFKWAIVLLLMLTLSHGGECNIHQYGEPPIPEGSVEPYTVQGELFSLMVPQGWTKSESNFPYEDPNLKTVGVKLIGPSNSYGVETEISLLYYPHGGFFNNYREYITMKQNSMVRLDNLKNGLTKTIVDGKKGVASTMMTFELVIEPGWTPPPFKEGVMYRMAPPHIQINMIEKFIVVPAKEGFFVFHYRAPEDRADDCKSTFERMIASLHFGNPKPWQEKVK